MAFIPIDAKADITGSKKGKLTPAQHAQLNAWCLAEKTGILDYLGCCKSKDDVLTYTVSEGKATIVLQKGFLVICGRLVECEEDTTIEVPAPVSGAVSGKICASFNLGSNGKEEFKIITKVGETLTQEDLNENPLSGIYEFELYSYTATPYLVTLKSRTIPYVPNIGGKLSQFITTITGSGVIGEGNPPLQDYDKSKGTIEERLTRLGFKEGSVTLSSGTATTNKITRQGNYVIGNVIVNSAKIGDKYATFFTLPEGFRPKSNFTVKIYVNSYDSTEVLNTPMVFDMAFNTDGTFKNSTINRERITAYQINFGFEAPPIN